MFVTGLSLPGGDHIIGLSHSGLTGDIGLLGPIDSLVSLNLEGTSVTGNLASIASLKSMSTLFLLNT